ncbi:sugar ABC transporter substrate-binding protein [Treponema parvum]|uniref:Sugar ABC transporter substrate-binding protein n=1 Tax=Treponema parvum TaxID=138851 RepID=A0A975IEZ5_9SPIR|nr:sugar ABC transporter substrate-binding protein [Treponema parvum]QTQ14595.1 sugar ABC transporter substrate-binding protein [Treponema parvum]
MKKFFCIFFASCLLCVAISAGGAKDESKKTITFGFWGDSMEANMKMELAKEYMKQHPDVIIEFEYTDGAGYLTKLQTWFSSNTTPDVFGVASDIITNFKDNPNFTDLNPYIKKDSMGKYWNLNTINSMYANSKGEVIAVPFISKVFAIAYNKDLFDKAGIPYPKDDWTVEDMIKAARAITSGEGVNKIYGIRWGVRPMEFYRNLYGTPVYEVGSKTINAKNNKEFKSAISLFADTIKEGLAPNETGGALSTGGFETGRFGMQLSATWDIATLLKLANNSLKWNVVMLPRNSQLNKKMLTTYRGNGWSISSKARHKDICWDFIKYMSATEEAQKKAQSFGLPELQSFAKSKEYLNDFGTSSSTYDKTVFIKMQEQSTSFTNMGMYAQINDVIKVKYELVLAGKLTVDQMAEQVQQEAEQLMASQK